MDRREQPRPEPQTTNDHDHDAGGGVVAPSVGDAARRDPAHRAGGAVGDLRRVAAVSATGLVGSAPEEAFDRLTRLAAEVVGATAVYVTLVDDRQCYVKSADADVAERRIPAGESFCRFVIDAGAEVIIPDTRLDVRTRGMDAVSTLAIAAWAGIPVRDTDGFVLGTFCALSDRPRPWSDRDLDVLRTLAQAAAGEIALRAALEASQQAYADAERHAAAAERHAALAEQRAREVTELAETLQQSLLPATEPRIPGMEVAARYRPGGVGSEVLGDFYDVFPVTGGWGVVVGDVCGKGAWAARTTALARSTVRAVGHLEQSPEAVLATLNDVLHVWFDGQPSFVTATYATITAADEGLSTVVVNGGHPPAFVLRADGSVGQYGEGGRALGLLPEPSVSCEVDCLRPGDSVVFYTDGVTESRRRGGTDQFEESGIARTLAGLPPGAGAEDIAEAVSAAALEHAGGQVPDDTAVVVVRNPVGPTPPSESARATTEVPAPAQNTPMKT